LSTTVFAFLIAMLLMGVGYSAFVSLSNSVLQLNTDERYYGSVNTIWTAAFVGSTAVGGPLMGWLAQHAGARPAIVFGGLAALLAAVIGNTLWSSKTSSTAM
jgi:MFS family permease